MNAESYVSIFLPEQEEPDIEAQERVRKATNNADLNVTCQVQITSDDCSKGWFLTSLDSRGVPQTSGGDEFYIRYTEEHQDKDDETSPSVLAVAMMEDLGNGTYRLNFCTSPTHPELPPLSTPESSQGGTLTIYFEYSNGMGQMPPPSKNAWENGGYTHTQYSAKVSQRPPIRRFTPPADGIDLSIYKLVVCFGDSTMDQFVRQRPNLKGKYYFQPNLLVGEKVRIGLNSRTVQELLRLLEQDHGDTLRSANDGENTALLVGSCLWDILDSQDTRQGKEYRDHAQACREFIHQIRATYPGVALLWKSPMAVHNHVVEEDRLLDAATGLPSLFGVDRVRYMSASRSKYLYELQRSVMKELQVPVLDLYEGTYLSSHRLYPSDGRHYRPDLNRLMLGWFYIKRQGNGGYYRENMGHWPQDETTTAEPGMN